MSGDARSSVVGVLADPWVVSEVFFLWVYNYGWCLRCTTSGLMNGGRGGLTSRVGNIFQCDL